MVDTEKTRADLQTALADNSTGAITPQDLRDFLASIDSAYGGLYISSSASATCTVADTYYVLSGSTILTTDSKNIGMPVSMSLSSSAVTPRLASMDANFSLTTDTVGTVYTFSFFKDDALLSGSAITHKINTGDSPTSISLHWQTPLSASSVLDVRVQENATAGSVITANSGSFFVNTFLI